MPKIIENLNYQLIATGKELLMEKGYKALTIREVAKRSGIAIGTVYNYFSGKDELIAQIMMLDWIGLFSDQNRMVSEKDCMSGLKEIYEMISSFVSRYRSIWQEYGSVSGVTSNRHHLLVQQISKKTKEVLEKHNVKSDDETISFVSEIILASAIREDVTFESITRFLEKIIS